MTSPTLTDAQARALRWIDRSPVNVSSWLRDNKSAFGSPDKWNQFRLSGPRGHITIRAEDWMAIKDFLDIVPEPGAPSPWKLNDAGRAALNGDDTPPDGAA